MTIDERIAQVTGDMNHLQQQAEGIDRQIVQLQQQRQTVVVLYQRAEGALAVLKAIKDDEPVPPEVQT